MGAVKFSKQNTQPNPIEIDYWVDIKADPYGSIWKYFNGDNWVTLKLGEGNSGLSPFDYYTKQQVNDLIKDKATISSVESKVDDDELADVIKNVSFSSSKDGGVTVTIFKYDDTTVAIPLPIASSTISGIVTSKDFEDFVKQHQLQSLYSEMYDKLAEIREKYQPRLKAGKNIQIDRVTNTIHATGKISTDWYDITNAPDFALQSDLENEIERATNTDKILDTKIASHVTTVETSLDLKADKADTYTKDQIDSKLSGVYRIKGSCLFEQLPTNAIIGDTWNILNDFTLDGEEHPFGTNVVYTENGWDALAGIFDSSELEGDISGVSEALAQESIRAAKAEQANAESIQSETNRAIARENAIDAAYKAADTILQNNINIVDGKLVNYLPISGGTINDTLTIGTRLVCNGILELNERNGAFGTYLANAGWIFNSDAHDLAIFDGVKWHTAIHSGNISSQSVNHAISTDILNGINTNDLTSVKAETGKLRGFYGVNKSVEGLFPSSNNANYILAINRHDENYSSQLGFSGIGGIYYRSFEGMPIDKTTPWKQIAFTDSNVASATNADMLDGLHLANKNQTYNKVPFVDISGVMEIGKYIDFHDTDREENDYSTRLQCTGSYKNVVRLPSTTGTLALTTDFVDWYGVSWSENDSDPTCTRIGNMAMHKSLPIQSAMKGYLITDQTDSNPEIIIPLTDDWSGTQYSTTSNSTILNDGTQSGSIMVKIPEFWYCDDYEPSTKTHNLKISQTAKAGWQHHKEAYVGAYEGFDDGTYYRSVNDKIPTVNTTREQFRTKARANGYEDESKWNIYTYEEHRAICHLFLVEYATRNSQASVNSTLTAEGFRQGGLGIGVTINAATINGITTYSYIPTGTTNSLGNGSGQVVYTFTNTDTDGNETNTMTCYVNRYRGIENPFGHVWKNCDDVVSVYNNGYRTWYKCEDPSQFATNKNRAYKPICSRAIVTGHKSEIAATINCDFFAETCNGTSSTYWCDYNYDNDATPEHCLLIGSNSGTVGMAGLFYLASDSGVSAFGTTICSRLTYLPWAE